jgi:hypothetical protein
MAINLTPRPDGTGQTAVGVLTFDEATPPADGAVMSDNPAVATASLDADMVTWTVTYVGNGMANISYTGTSAPPDVGPAVVAPIAIICSDAPVAEMGNFNPDAAVVS